jgi:hypothetical protein
MADAWGGAWAESWGESWGYSYAPAGAVIGPRVFGVISAMGMYSSLGIRIDR